MRRYAFGFCLAAASVVVLHSWQPTMVSAHEGATGVVRERMFAMKDLGAATKSLAQMYKGERDFDALQARTHARNIAGFSGQHMLDVFPPFSNEHPSESRDEIWSDWDRFSLLAMELQVAADALTTSVEEGLEASRPSFRRMIQSCHDCHEDYRERR